MEAPELERLRAALQRPLPGHDSFLELSGYKRPDIERARRADPPPRESAVMILLHEQDDALHTLLMLRPDYDGVHGGQVSFPGGKREPEDIDLSATALREFYEETGANDTVVDLLGAITPIYIPPSRMLVTPIVGHARQLGALSPDPREVAQLIHTPLAALMSDEILKRREQYIHLMGGPVEIPYFDVQGHVVWGATAMMIAELRELLRG